MAVITPMSMVSSTTANPAKVHKLYNLILPVSLARRQVLLGYKRRGFGVGKFNGFGGKVEPEESMVASAKRELEEESGIVCTEDQLHHHAILLLETVAPGAEHEKLLEIHVFVCTEWEGEIVETDEMRPEWFAPENLPLDEMWEETRIWMSTALKLYLPHAELPPPSRNLPTEIASKADGVSGDKKWFIHYVDFHGGVNAQTGEWDPWHGMGTSIWEWFDKPLDGWSREEVATWVDGRRGRSGNLPN